MTWPSERTVARWMFAASSAFNGGIVLGDLATGRYEAAALQSVVLVAMTTWFLLFPKIDARLDARLAEAIAEQRMAEMALVALEETRNRGELQVEVRMERGPRPN